MSWSPACPSTSGISAAGTATSSPPTTGRSWPADFDRFSVAAPRDDRLPGGGGGTVGNLYDVTPTKFGQIDNLLTFADNYGEQIENWQGVDVGVKARLPRGITAQGGLSTGRTLTDNCAIRAVNPELTVAGGVSPTNPYCRVVTPYLTQFKLAAAYTIPGADVLLAATVQSIPGPFVQAAVTYPSLALVPSLGRPLAGDVATAQVNVIPAGTEVGDRLNQLDFRVGKVFKYGAARTSVNFDLFNALNGNAVLTENPSYTLYRQPLSILNARLMKFSVNFDF